MSEETLRLELAAERNEIARLESELREARDALRAARFSPLGDNHHNAAECPYCGDPLRAAQAALSAERTARRVLREALEALRACFTLHVHRLGEGPTAHGVTSGTAERVGENVISWETDWRAFLKAIPTVDAALAAERPYPSTPPEGHPRAAEEKT